MAQGNRARVRRRQNRDPATLTARKSSRPPSRRSVRLRGVVLPACSGTSTDVAGGNGTAADTSGWFAFGPRVRGGRLVVGFVLRVEATLSRKRWARRH